MAELAAREIPLLKRGLPSVSAVLLASGQTPFHGATLPFLSGFIMGYMMAFSALNSTSHESVTFCRHTGWSSSVPANDTLEGVSPCLTVLQDCDIKCDIKKKRIC